MILKNSIAHDAEGQQHKIANSKCPTSHIAQRKEDFIATNQPGHRRTPTLGFIHRGAYTMINYAAWFIHDLPTSTPCAIREVRILPIARSIEGIKAPELYVHFASEGRTASA